jgi:hypothetical protein
VGSEKSNGADFDSLCGYVLLLKLSSDVAFNKGSFTHTSVSDEHNLELCNNRFLNGIDVTSMFEAAILSNYIDYCRS